MAADCNFWFEVIKYTSPLLCAILVVYLTYRYAIKQKKIDIAFSLKRVKYERKLNALEECWKLCMYMTESENYKSILTWEKEKGSDNVYYFHKSNAEEFKKLLVDFFYGSGLGIYLNKEIKEKIFEYRGIIFGILLSEANNLEDKIRIKNPKAPERMNELFRDLILTIKKETDIIEQKPVNVYVKTKAK
jgi:hypothetical protein